MRTLRSLSLFFVLAAAVSAQRPADPVDFNRDIRGLLSDRCFQCHGTDARARKAGLRLDTWDGLTGVRDGRAAVVPGDPGRSELIRRIHSPESNKVMPPPESGLALDDDERALLRRWIEEGADFAPHWAFVTPEVPALPEVNDLAWGKRPLDTFVLARLEAAGIAPSPQADRETLIRRASLDLTGLPPTPDQIDAFLADTAPGAYERLVDSLLASPRFGERMASMWLDLARYADTNGFHHDNVRTGWPYRDWVIRAFNDNVSYDRFLVEQLAGDLLPNPTQQQRIATAFCRMHNINDEGGALDQEYRVEAVADRIETIATVGMGLTFTCARCHDHKYDPITQDDYYSLFAFFNSVEERGVYSNNFEQSRAYPPRLDFLPPATQRELGQAATALERVESELEASRPAIDAERAQWRARFVADRGVQWVDARLAAFESEMGLPMERADDGSVRVIRRAVGQPAKVAPIPSVDTHRFVYETDARELRLVALRFLADPKFPKGRVGLANNGNAVVSGVRVKAISRIDESRVTEIPFERVWADYEQPNEDFDADNLLGDGKKFWALGGHDRKGGRTLMLVSRAPFGFDGGTRLEVEIDYRSVHGQHLAGRTDVRFARAQPRPEDFPVRTSDWFLVGPFRNAPASAGSSAFDRLYAHAFGPEQLTEFRLDQVWAKRRPGHRPKFVDGQAHTLRGERTVHYLMRSFRSSVARKIRLSLGSDDGIRVFLNGAEVHGNKTLRGVKPNDDRVDVDLPAGESVLVVKIINSGGPGGFYFDWRLAGETRNAELLPVAYLDPAHCNPQLAEAFADEWNTSRSSTFAELSGRRVRAEQKIAELRKQAAPVLVMQEKAEPTETFVLARGAYDAADEKRPVTRRPPKFLGVPMPDGAPSDRLGFARWLTRSDHPLTARVHVNRLWQLFFGRGIVSSLENLGQQAPWPSHLQLLDWLAVRFVESGWDQKALIRRIVTSATYRQSAKRDAEAAAKDPRNRLLGRFPRRRLSGEMIRDLALFTSGLMVDTVGGPSVRPYQPDGLWREVSIGGSSNTQVFRRDSGAALYRRSLYTFWKRTSPNPQMQTFDAPTREFCVVQRGTTNTPLQVLVLWNDEQFLEAARSLAERTLAAPGSTDDRLSELWRRCTGRRPSPRELTTLRSTLEHYLERYRSDVDDARALLAVGERPVSTKLDPSRVAAWTMIASTVLALDETLVCD